MFEKYAIYAALVAALCATSFIKGCEYGRDDAENQMQEGRRLADKESAKILEGRLKREEAHEKRQKEDSARIASLTATNGRLRGDLRRLPQCADPVAESAAAEVRGLYQDCRAEYIRMGWEAQKASSTGQLCEAEYSAVKNAVDSIRKRTVK